MTVVLHASTDRHHYWGGPKRYIRIFVYDTQDELVDAAQKYYVGNDVDEETAACFHPAVWREKSVGDEWVDCTDPHYAGIMRLQRDFLDAEIVIHECTHAALHIYRMDVNRQADIGSDCREEEENLAYIIGDVTSSVVGKLYLSGVWPPGGDGRG